MTRSSSLLSVRFQRGSSHIDKTHTPDIQTVASFDYANFRQILGYGWSAIEDGFVWSCQKHALLRFTLPPSNDEYLIRMIVDGYLIPGHLSQQRVLISLNDSDANETVVDGQGALECQIAAHHESETTLRLHLPDARRPCEMDADNRDDRMLGILLRQIVVYKSTSAEAPSAAKPYRSERAMLSESAKTEIMTRFESLGENCEFDLAQRRCASEPLGLLRFSSSPLSKLIAALNSRFTGMGISDNIVVELSPNKTEYMIRDLAFGFYYHAWVKPGELSPERIKAREAARVPFLVRKLREDLTEGQKIFVFHPNEEMSVAAARSLLASIRSYGPGTLLWIRLAQETHPAGSADLLDEGLIAGYIDRFAPAENAHDLSLDCWIEICRSALQCNADRLSRPQELKPQISIGYVDDISRLGVIGRAADPSQPSKQLEVHIYLNGNHHAKCRADLHREGLSAALDNTINDDHGFEFRFLPNLLSFETYDICVNDETGAPITNGTRRIDSLLRRHPVYVAQKTPLIVSSCDRSGTAFLMGYLSAFPQFVIAPVYPYEVQLINYAVSAIKTLASTRYTGSEEVDFVELTNTHNLIAGIPWNNPGFHRMLSAENNLTALMTNDFAGNLSAVFRSLVLDYYKTIASAQDKESFIYFIEKGDLNEDVRLGSKALFPELKEIVLVRDPRDFLASARQFWKMTKDERLIAARTTYSRIEQIMMARDEHVYVQSYETLLIDP